MPDEVIHPASFLPAMQLKIIASFTRSYYCMCNQFNDWWFDDEMLARNQTVAFNAVQK